MEVSAQPSLGGGPGTAAAPLRVWLPTMVAVAAACAVFGVAFQREIVGAVRVWSTSTAYNHGFLVLPMFAVLIWQRRDVLALLRPSPSPSPWALALVPAVSAVWLAAALLDILEGEQLAVVALFEVLLLALLGWRVFIALLAPLLFLFFLVPFGEFLVPTLQQITASFTVRGLRLLGIPVFADGFIIQIPEGYFEVAEACAGLRFLIASVVFGCFYATVVYRSWIRRLLFIGLSIALPIVANGLRALGLVLLGHISGNSAAALADHILYGWIFFTLVTLLLVAIGLTFADGPRSHVVGPAMPGSPPASSLGMRLAATAVAGLLLALVGPAYIFAIDRASAAPVAAAMPGPHSDSGWVADPVASGDWRPIANGAERASLATYRNGDASVSEFVALYRLPSRGSPLTRTANAVVAADGWRIAQTGRMTASLGGAPVTINTATIAREGQQRVVWWFYVVDGQAVAGTLQAKLLQARAALRGGTHVGALVAISSPTDDTAPSEPLLAPFLKTLRPLPGAPAASTGG